MHHRESGKKVPKQGKRKCLNLLMINKIYSKNLQKLNRLKGVELTRLKKKITRVMSLYQTLNMTLYLSLHVENGALEDLIVNRVNVLSHVVMVDVQEALDVDVDIVSLSKNHVARMTIVSCLKDAQEDFVNQPVQLSHAVLLVYVFMEIVFSIPESAEKIGSADEPKLAERDFVLIDVSVLFVQEEAALTESAHSQMTTTTEIGLMRILMITSIRTGTMVVEGVTGMTVAKEVTGMTVGKEMMEANGMMVDIDLSSHI